MHLQYNTDENEKNRDLVSGKCIREKESDNKKEAGKREAGGHWKNH